MIHRAGQRLLPPHVRAVTFGTRRWRGLDPDQVYAFLDQVADELERLHRDLTVATTEGERIRGALRRWGSGHLDRRPTRLTRNSWWPR
ncbi:DivIVA domain-containing protein [Micromonospora sp. NPDC051925]|uniref:DivIVA domain-containing protein n=1 Tax=Micromonospora sp. NPDC051925 TaxID=3364288 RepID=UPI0037CAE3A9